MKTFLILIGVLAALVATTAANGAMIAHCKGSQLAGTFTVVKGSAGAGNIVYALRLKNVSSTACFVTGLPQGQLLGQHGGALPTHVRAAFPGALAAVLVTLKPGEVTRATARFSPDVPGTGDKTNGACEPTAYSFRVTGQGGGTTTVKLVPPTPVCERGQLQFSAYGR
jgi:hypothetical protein